MHRIAHTTDFSGQSTVAFHHALGIALATRSRLDLLHVKEPAAERAWSSFPHVREVLIAWGLLGADAKPSDIDATLGVHVSKIEIDHRDAQGGIARFFEDHTPDLLVVATHGREGVNRWLHGSVAQDLVRRTHVPTLMIGPESRGFIGETTGALRLQRVLMPVAATPSPLHALLYAADLLAPLGVTVSQIQLVTVGDDPIEILAPAGPAAPVEHLHGSVAEAILQVARDRDVDLIVMPTAGSHGFLDIFRGSTTSRVLPHAPCPVLSLPMIAE